MQTLDRSKTYSRRITVLDIVTLIMIIGLLFVPSGQFLSLLLIVVYPISHSKILVADINNHNQKLWVRSMDWNSYRKEHNIGYFSQYRVVKNDLVHVNQI